MNRITSRRDLLIGAGLGAGGLALSALAPGRAFASQATDNFIDPLAPKQPHFPAKVKSVIWLHMAGAPSTLDLFDYKPQLIKLHGQPLPESFSKGLKTATDGGVGALTATKRTWKTCSAPPAPARSRRHVCLAAPSRGQPEASAR